MAVDSHTVQCVCVGRGGGHDPRTSHHPSPGQQRPQGPAGSSECSAWSLSRTEPPQPAADTHPSKCPTALPLHTPVLPLLLPGTTSQVNPLQPQPSHSEHKGGDGAPGSICHSSRQTDMRGHRVVLVIFLLRTSRPTAALTRALEMPFSSKILGTLTSKQKQEVRAAGQRGLTVSPQPG